MWYGRRLTRKRTDLFEYLCESGARGPMVDSHWVAMARAVHITLLGQNPHVLKFWIKVMF